MAIDLSALLDRGVIFLEQSCGSRKQAIVRLSGALAEKLGLDDRAIFDAVMEREQLGSTGVGEGVAIPHARLSKIDTPVGGFMKLSEGVEFDAVDERPCDLVFMLLAPMTAGADHLRALAQVSRAFRKPEVRAALRGAADAKAIHAILCQASKASTASAA
ncbi:MAG: PTS sugar transporter subunit IIA [Hyphomonadaceae bacterium]|nr:PTS sugar transporter subunit IIA [Hyphomonadaceae bacterium]